MSKCHSSGRKRCAAPGTCLAPARDHSCSRHTSSRCLVPASWGVSRAVASEPLFMLKQRVLSKATPSGFPLDPPLSLLYGCAHHVIGRLCSHAVPVIELGVA